MPFDSTQKALKERIEELIGLISDNKELESNQDDIVSQLEECLQQADSMQLYVAFIGVLKAGKSSCIDAIVGRRVCPHRNLACTLVPTIVKHDANVADPVLTFPKPKPFVRALKAILFRTFHDKGNLKGFITGNSWLDVILCDTWIEAGGDEDNTTEGEEQAREKGKEKAKEEDGPRTGMRPGKKGLGRALAKKLGLLQGEQITGEDKILEVLQACNDAVRVSSSLNLDNPLLQGGGVSRLADLPTVSVAFLPLMEGNHPRSLGNLCLIDTPGPNEHKLPWLAEYVNSVIQQASVTVFVMKYGDMNAAAAGKLVNSLATIKKRMKNVHGQLNKTYVLVNMIDQINADGLSEDKLPQYVSEHIMPGLDKEDVFPVCALRAFQANRLAQHRPELDPPLNLQVDWFVDILKSAHGCWYQETYEKEKNHPAYLRKLRQSVWETSHLSRAIDTMLTACYEGAAPRLLHNIAAKCRLLTANRLQCVLLRSQCLNSDKAQVEQTLRKLRDLKRSARKAQEDLRKSKEQLQRRLFAELKEELTKIHGETIKRLKEWHTQKKAKEFWAYYQQQLKSPDEGSVKLLGTYMTGDTNVTYYNDVQETSQEKASRDVRSVLTLVGNLATSALHAGLKRFEDRVKKYVTELHERVSRVDFLAEMKKAVDGDNAQSVLTGVVSATPHVSKISLSTIEMAEYSERRSGITTQLHEATVYLLWFIPIKVMVPVHVGDKTTIKVDEFRKVIAPNFPKAFACVFEQ